MTNDLDTCANCGHERYHHGFYCDYYNPMLQYGRCFCQRFVEQTGDER